MADLTSEAKVDLRFLPLNSTPRCMLLRYIPTCMCVTLLIDMCVTLLIGYHAFLIQWLRLWHGGHVQIWSPS